MTNRIYAYTVIGKNDDDWQRSIGETATRGRGLIKVGQTSLKKARTRIKQQLGTAYPKLEGVEILLDEPATREDGSEFSDHDVHHALVAAGIKRPGGEWFEATLDEVKAAIEQVRTGATFDPTRTETFKMRPEQSEAVKRTALYFQRHAKGEVGGTTNSKSPKFLWNAKMRFGKTFTSYQLARRMGWNKMLVLTYKPAVQAAWRDDLLNHVDFAGWRFIDRNTAIPERNKAADATDPQVWFASFQDLNGRTADGDIKAHNEAIHLIDWDAIVIDEYHFGAWRDSARDLYDPSEKDVAEHEEPDEQVTDDDLGLNAGHYLYLSGTPFRAVTNGEFTEDQIFNWTYVDEQSAKNHWNEADGLNPYRELPRMEMYSYRMGEAAEVVADDGEFDGFSLSEYFKASKAGAAAKVTDPGACVFEDPTRVLEFLQMLRGKLARQMKMQVLAAGNAAGQGAAALPPVEVAIGTAIKEGRTGSITLSCGKLLTGVTVPQWGAIFMLRSLKSPESYFQAAFRVQSPWAHRDAEGKLQVKKETCYVFEFDPNRALSLVAEYGVRLGGTGEVTPSEAIGQLINYLPIFAFEGGQMLKLDAQAVMDWATAGVGASALAARWNSPLLVDVNEHTLGAILEHPDLLEALEQIEDFRALADHAKQIITSTKKLKKAKREQGGQLDSGQKKEQSETAKKRKEIREKLQKFLAKIPVFMYVTDFREEALKHVIESLDSALFERVTGLTVDDFKMLSDLGLFNAQHMNAAIYQFKAFEDASLHYADDNPPGPRYERVGLWDTSTIARVADEPEAPG